MLALFFDLEKAFDKTCRFNTLSRLHEWKFRGNLPKFTFSFLKDKTFQVNVSGSHSQTNMSLKMWYRRHLFLVVPYLSLPSMAYLML